MTPFVDNRHIYLFVYFTIFHIKREPVACIERRYCFPADFFFKPFTGVACKFAAAFFPFIGKFFAHFYRLKSLIDPTFRIAFRSIKICPAKYRLFRIGYFIKPFATHLCKPHNENSIFSGSILRKRTDCFAFNFQRKSQMAL